ncbi:NEW3 domain-containing protein [Streptomyces poriticola]|uniref:NEW3 domain-containing protein n=1 Tax=Streptomyces poriticola TaxID=3120506 RepID=UPI002FCE0B56
MRAGAAADVVHHVTTAGDATTGALVAAAYGDGDGLLVHADTRTTAAVTPVLGVALSAPASSPRTAGAVVSPGRPVEVTATVTNSGREAIGALTARLTVPAGWSARPSGDIPTGVEAGGTATLGWTVTADGSAARSTATLTTTVTGALQDGAGGGAEADAELAVTVGPDLRGRLLVEDFESLLPLPAPAVDLNVPEDVLGWTQTPPEGWNIVNAPGVPAGPTEETGWSRSCT